MKDTYKLPHRLIEKKRRDRINECIAQLKDLLPEHLKLTVRCTFSFFDDFQGVLACYNSQDRIINVNIKRPDFQLVLYWRVSQRLRTGAPAEGRDH